MRKDAGEDQLDELLLTEEHLLQGLGKGPDVLAGIGDFCFRGVLHGGNRWNRGEAGDRKPQQADSRRLSPWAVKNQYGNPWPDGVERDTRLSACAPLFIVQRAVGLLEELLESVLLGGKEGALPHPGPTPGLTVDVSTGAGTGLALVDIVFAILEFEEIAGQGFAQIL